MTISSNAAPKAGPFNGNGVQTVFPFTFHAFAKADLLVVSAVTVTGIQTTLVLDSNYSVALNADQSANPGGSVTYPISGTPLPVGSTLTIVSDIDYTQILDLINGGGFYPEVIEDSLDRGVMQSKQVLEIVSRTLQVAVSTPSSVSVTLPAPSANQLIGWNGTATGLVNYTPDVSSAAGLQIRLADTVSAANGAAMLGRGGQVVASIAALRQLLKTNPSTNATVTGYYAAGDGGGGQYYYDSTDAASADNGGTIIVASDGGRWKLSDQEFVSVCQWGAKGDGVTSNAAAFTAMEASTVYETFYVPDGKFLSGATALKKQYFGPGAVLFTNGSGQGAMPSSLEAVKTPGLAGINSGSSIGQRNDIYIGDSITYGSGVTGAQSWPYLVQQWVNRMMAFGQGSYQSGGNLDRLTQAGVITAGTSGPIASSLILAVGASLTFTADYIDTIAFWFQRAVGAGTITVRQGATVILTQSCAGAAASNVLSSTSTFCKGGLAGSYSLTCTVAPVEINGILALHDTGSAATNPVVIEVQAKSGYATSDFTPAAVITAIKTQATFGAYFPRVILALGTNDIYSASKAVTSAVYKANLISIITQIGVATTAFVLTVPLRAGNGTYSPVLEPFDNYRNAVYEIARQYSLDVIDFSELDLISVGAYQADGLHPNNYGHAIMADYVFKRLYASMYAADRTTTLALSGGATAVGGVYAPPAATMGIGGKVSLAGTLVVSAIAKGTVIATMPQAFAPLLRRVITAPTLTTAGSAILLVDPNGQITLFEFTAGAITNVSFDNISYFCG